MMQNTRSSWFNRARPDHRSADTLGWEFGTCFSAASRRAQEKLDDTRDFQWISKKLHVSNADVACALPHRDPRGTRRHQRPASGLGRSIGRGNSLSATLAVFCCGARCLWPSRIRRLVITESSQLVHPCAAMVAFLAVRRFSPGEAEKESTSARHLTVARWRFLARST